MFSRFSGGFRGWGIEVSQPTWQQRVWSETYWFGEEEVMVFRLYSQVLEDGVGPETLHVILPNSSASRRQPSTKVPAPTQFSICPWRMG